MLTIKDFKVGSTAYVVCENGGTNKPSEISEHKIQAVGRKYVTIGQHKRYENAGDEYLKEQVEYGEASLLFDTKANAELYVEKCTLALWLGQITVSQAKKYTVEQLREIKKIIMNPKEMTPEQEKTNGEKIRKKLTVMDDKEMAEKMIEAGIEDTTLIPFCRNSKKCNDLLEEGNDIPIELCVECLTEWLQQKGNNK